MAKKIKKYKRDWTKYPDLYDYITESSRLMSDLVVVKNIVHGFGYDKDITDLEKLLLIHEAVFAYDKDVIESAFIRDKILTGKVKPRNKEDLRRIKEYNKSEIARRMSLKQEAKEQRKIEKFEKAMRKR